MILKRSFHYHTNVQNTIFCRCNTIEKRTIHKKLGGNFGTKQSNIFMFVCVGI